MQVSSFFLLIYLLPMQISGEEETPMEKLDDNPELRKFFDKPRPHQYAPIYLCPKYTNGIIYALPELPDCSQIDYSENSTEVEILLYWTDLQQKSISGHECWVQRQNFYVRKSVLWTTLGKWFDPQPTFDILPPGTCKSMIQTSYHKNEQLLTLSSGLIGTNNPPAFNEEGWAGTVTNTVENAFVQEVRIQVDNRDNSIYTIGVPLKRKCYANETFCPTSRGMLRWDGEAQSTCRLKVGSQQTCLLTGRRLTCPGLSVYLPTLKVEEVCGGIRLYTSGFGGYFTVTKGERLLPDKLMKEDAWSTSATMTTLKEHKIKVPFDSHIRRKRSTGLQDPAPVFYSQYVWQQQWVLDVSRRGTRSDIAQFHFSSCNTNKQTLSLAYYLSKKDPTAAVQTLTSDPSLRASWLGDLLNVYSCEVMTKWKFDPTPRVNCTEQWPITFYGSDDVKRTAYLEAHSHEITYTPTYVSCPEQKPFYFKTGEEAHAYIQLNNRSLSLNFMVLPNRASIKYKADEHDVAFHPNIAYTFEEAFNRNGEADNQRAANRVLNSLTVAMRANAEKSPVPAAAEEDVDGLRWTMFGDYILMMKAILGALFVIALFTGLAFVGVYKKQLKPIWKPLCTPVRNFLSALRDCLCKKKGKRDDEEAQNMMGSSTASTGHTAFNMNFINSNPTAPMQNRALPAAPSYPNLNNL